ncbi:hypothetical protein [Streptomonospora alba]|nr:hypothetical protein [Streptomonospora alba]
MRHIAGTATISPTAGRRTLASATGRSVEVPMRRLRHTPGIADV